MWEAIKKTAGFIKQSAAVAAEKIHIPYISPKHKAGIGRWGVIAAQFARKAASLREQSPWRFAKPVYIEKKNKTAFETLYHELITTKLLGRGFRLTTDRAAARFTVSYHTKLLSSSVLITTDLSDGDRLLVQTAQTAQVASLEDRRYYSENMLMDPAMEKSYKRFQLVDKD